MNKTLITLGCSNNTALRERAVASALVLQHVRGYSRVILSGGLPKDGVTEAEKMHQCIKRVIPESSKQVEFVLEGNSTNTEENFQLIDDIEKSRLRNGELDYDVVSSRSHLWGIRKLLKRYPNLYPMSCEAILKRRVGNAGKIHPHHMVYWGYEMMRPISRIPASRKLIQVGKGLANKI